jgi:hypothetical protein
MLTGTGFALRDLENEPKIIAHILRDHRQTPASGGIQWRPVAQEF